LIIWSFGYLVGVGLKGIEEGSNAYVPGVHRGSATIAEALGTKVLAIARLAVLLTHARDKYHQSSRGAAPSVLVHQRRTASPPRSASVVLSRRFLQSAHVRQDLCQSPPGPDARSTNEPRRQWSLQNARQARSTRAHSTDRRLPRTSKVHSLRTPVNAQPHIKHHAQPNRYHSMWLSPSVQKTRPPESDDPLTYLGHLEEGRDMMIERWGEMEGWMEGGLRHERGSESDTIESMRMSRATDKEGGGFGR